MIKPKLRLTQRQAVYALFAWATIALAVVIFMNTPSKGNPVGPTHFGYTGVTDANETGPAMFGYVRVTPDNEVITGGFSPQDELDNPPRLIGIGCKGARGPLWADEEDDFPGPCDRIELIPLYRDDGQQPD